MKIYYCIEKDCMMIIIRNGTLFSQALTDIARKQCQIMKKNAFPTNKKQQSQYEKDPGSP